MNLNQGNTTMKLLNIFKSFKNDESGAVTVDWVVLTGAVVGLGIIIANTMGTSIQTAATGVGADVISNSDN
jgi:Flp pilus assembly pilin Flp